MKMEWFIYSLVSMFFLAALFLLIKKISILGVRSDVLLMYYFGLAAVFLFIFLLSSKTSLSINKYILFLLLLTAVVGVLGNLYLVKSMAVSPNPGYSLAVAGVHILLVGVASVFLFKSDFGLTKVIGAILAISGIILLGLK